MVSFRNNSGKPILMSMVAAIQENKAYLGEIDGLIGDGDHGMNMNKGFTAFGIRFQEADISFTDGLNELGLILLNEIGGSMGPIYGTLFMEMADAGDGLVDIGIADMSRMLDAGLNGLCAIIDAKAGDKTLMDTLYPAADSLRESADANLSFDVALEKMKEAARKGQHATKDMIAKYGRASRLSERSRGVLDAGATSCYILLDAMANGIINMEDGGIAE